MALLIHTESELKLQAARLTTNRELIVEKISRPEPPPFARPRLRLLLEKSLSSRTCTIVSGRAGTGKSALAADFATCCNRRVAWYKVDAPDSELSVFFDYLASSIGQQRPAFDEQAIRSLATSVKAAEVSRFSERFVFELMESGSSPLLIVIEDLHLVCDTEWLAPFLDRFLQLAPLDAHVLIVSRTLPRAPLWRMRSKQTLAVIDEAELAFTRDEAVKLFETAGLSHEHAYLAFDGAKGRAGALVKYVEMLTKPSPGSRNFAAEPGKRSKTGAPNP